MGRNVKRFVAGTSLIAMLLLGPASAALACIPYPGSGIWHVKNAVCIASQSNVCLY